MTYPSGNNVPHTSDDWVVYADQRGRQLGRSAFGGNIEKLATARFKFDQRARTAFITAYHNSKSEKQSDHTRRQSEEEHR